MLLFFSGPESVIGKEVGRRNCFVNRSYTEHPQHKSSDVVCVVREPLSLVLKVV